MPTKRQRKLASVPERDICHILYSKMGVHYFLSKVMALLSRNPDAITAVAVETETNKIIILLNRIEELKEQVPDWS